MNAIRDLAEQEMVNKLRKRFPTARVSNPVHNKYAGDKITMTIDGERIYIYFFEEIGEDGLPWFDVELSNGNGRAGNIEETLEYIENNI